jgi:hypothetical protein
LQFIKKWCIMVFVIIKKGEFIWNYQTTHLQF